MLGWLCEKFLSYFHVRPVHVKGINNYKQAKDSSEYAVAVFNHCFFTDIALIVQHIDHVAFVGYGKHLNNPMVAPFARALRCIPVPSTHPRRSVTDQIQEYTVTRKKGQPLLAIAPDAAEVPTEESGPINYFRSGAFASRCKVVPIVIRYFPDMPIWPKGKSMPDMMKVRREGGPLSVTISVLPPMVPTAGETVTDFKERVRSTMTSEFLSLMPPITSSQGRTTPR